MSNEGHALDWDSKIENDGESFILLPAGDYKFTVVDVEKSRNEKWNCPVLKLKLKVESSQGSTTVNEQLMLHSKFEWKICQFFTAIGHRKSGEPLIPKWNHVLDESGIAKIKIDEYEKEGETKQINRVDKFLEPSTVTANDIPSNDVADDDF